MSGAGLIDEDPSHQARRDAEELRAVLPDGRSLIDEPQVEFVHERGGRDGMACAFAPELARGNPAQFGVDERNEPVERVESVEDSSPARSPR
jgi:hypothetical protein